MMTDTKFGWTDFYMEFADKLLAYRENRKALVEEVLRVCRSLGYDYLNEFSAAAEGEISPFTTIGTFNQRRKSDHRKKVAAELGRFLGVTEPVPESFNDIPSFPTNLPATLVVGWDGNLDPVWQIFADAIRLADQGDEHARQSFVESYDQVQSVKGVGMANLSFGLFWTRPHRFLPLFKRVEQYASGPLGITIPPRMLPNPTGSEYLDLTDKLKELFIETDSPVHSFQELWQTSWSAILDESRDPNIDATVAETEEPIQPSLESVETPPYTLQDIINDGCFLEQSQLETILNRLKVKKNLILQGPPGTGKTWLAKKLAFALIGQKDNSRVRRFQFHPNLSYEDFILGYRPNDESKLTLVKGPFLETVTRARDDQSNDYVIVIEEINRGNPAQIFGEMLTLLEADKRNPDEALRLAYSSSDSDQSVYIPSNVYVIGTMNVADRSIALVDLALRRRFAFIDLEPVFGEVWRNWVHEQCGIPNDFLASVEQRMTTLNQRIESDRSLGSQFCVGHSYVTPAPGTHIDDPVEWFRDVVHTEIGPLLDEYWFDNADVAQSAKSELLSGP